MAKGQRRGAATRHAGIRLELDEAVIALFIGAMMANGHFAPAEAARAHHLIWSTRRFRRKSGEAVGKLIEDVRDLLEQHDPERVVEIAARTIPARLRPSAFAVIADLLLADGKMDARERRFLRRTGSMLKITPDTMRQVTEISLLKNQL